MEEKELKELETEQEEILEEVEEELAKEEPEEEKVAELEERAANLQTAKRNVLEAIERKAHIETVALEEVKENKEMNAEERAISFMEKRSGKFNTRSLLTANAARPTGVGGINDSADKPGNLLDLIKITDCTGMGQYKVGYQTTAAAAAAVTEGSAIGGTEAGWAFATINPSDVGLISYLSRDVMKQTPLQYEEKVQGATEVALQKAMRAKVVTAITSSTISRTVTGTFAYDKDLVDSIVLGYAGDEAIAGDAYIICNKTTLKAIAGVKGKNEYLPVHNIIPDAGTTSLGTIKVNNGLQCRYCVDANVADNVIIYGNPKAAELALFGDVEVAVSEDAAFTSNLLTVRGIASVGADVTTYHGFDLITVTP